MKPKAKILIIASARNKKVKVLLMYDSTILNNEFGSLRGLSSTSTNEEIIMKLNVMFSNIL